MASNWRLIQTMGHTAQEIMDKDARLLAEIRENDPLILHFYDWQVPSLTYGYFTNPAQHLNFEALQNLGIDKARRPTGGGVIFHLADFAFSLLIPSSYPHISANTLENYAFINSHVSCVIRTWSQERLKPLFHQNKASSSIAETFDFCMARPTIYDLMIEGKKVGGAAQRKTKTGLLHQASLSICPICPSILKQVLLSSGKISAEMEQVSGYLNSDALSENLKKTRAELKLLLQDMMQLF